MKQFWRIVIGVAMVAFGAVGLISSLMTEDDGIPEPVITDTRPDMPGYDREGRPLTDTEEEAVAGEDAADVDGSPSASPSDGAGDAAPDASPTPELTPEERAEERQAFRDLIKDRDVEGCGDLRDGELEVACRDTIRTALALRDKSLTTCDMIETADQQTACRDQVLLTRALDDDEFEGCLEIRSATLRKRCQEEEARFQITQVRSYADCEKVSSQERREACFDFYIAKQAMDDSRTQGAVACEAIDDEGTRQTCLVNSAVRLASSENSIIPCQDLASEELQDACIGRVQQLLRQEDIETSIATADLSGCESMTMEEGRQYCIDNTLMTQAVTQHDPELCDQIVDDNRRRRCERDATDAQSKYYYRMAREDRDTKWCSLISDQLSQENCLGIVRQMAQSNG